MSRPSDLAKFRVLLDDKPAGPFSLRQLRDMLADGRVTPATLFSLEGAEGWHPISELEQAVPRALEAVGLGELVAPAAPAAPSSRLPSEILKDIPSFGSVMIDLFLSTLFIVGIGLALFYAFIFETAPGGTFDVGRANDRLVGVVCGIGLAVIVCLIKIVRKLPSKT